MCVYICVGKFWLTDLLRTVFISFPGGLPTRISHRIDYKKRRRRSIVLTLWPRDSYFSFNNDKVRSMDMYDKILRLS